MDVFSIEKRSAVMRSVKSKNTKPELRVRHLLHRAGLRYRLHRADLPGKPDLTFPSKRKVIFIHGCFWHQHPGCHHADRPASNNAYWQRKLNRNVARDTVTLEALKEKGWEALIIWECQIRNEAELLDAVNHFLDR